MMENLSPEVWASTSTPSSQGRASQSDRQEDRAESRPPRPGEVLRDIGLVLAIHIVLVAVVLAILQVFSIN